MRPMVKVTARRRQGFTHDVEIQGGHHLVIDEPEADGGSNAGPSPTRTVGAALAACTAITTEMYADRKGWELGEVEVDVSDDQLERLRVIAGKCPVHRLLAKEAEVTITDRVERVQ